VLKTTYWMKFKFDDTAIIVANIILGVEFIGFVHDFRLPLQSTWESRSFWLLRSE